MSEIWRVLRPSGWLILTVDLFADERGWRSEDHPFSFTRSALRELLVDYQVVMQRLQRRKLGVGPYVHYRLTKGHSPRYVGLRYGAVPLAKSLAKELLRYGGLGEVVVVCRKAA